MVKKVIRLESQKALCCQWQIHIEISLALTWASSFLAATPLLPTSPCWRSRRMTHQRGQAFGDFPPSCGAIFPEIDGAKPFAVEAFCHFKNCHLFNMAAGAPRLLVGKPIQDCETL